MQMQDLNDLVWKGHKTLGVDGKYQQTEKKLIDMGEVELRGCYEHCKTMLYNQDPQKLGRYPVLLLITDQKNRCGAELFLRYVESTKSVSRFNLMSNINLFLTKHKEELKGTKPTVEIMFDNIPDEYAKIPIDLLIDGCLDRLRVFDKKHITRTFILKQGIWLTPAESKELAEEVGNNIADKLSVIRERLNIKPEEKLMLNSKGLNYAQLRAMLSLKPNKKYRDLTTTQLELLRNRILFTLEETVKEHINSWENRIVDIDMVATYKGFRM